MGHQLWTVHCFPPPAEAGISTGRPVSRSYEFAQASFTSGFAESSFPVLASST